MAPHLRRTRATRQEDIQYAEVYAKSKAWACEQLRKGTTRGLVMGLEGKMWTGLVRRVGVGMGLKTDGEDRPKRRGAAAPMPAAARGAVGPAAATPRAGPNRSPSPGVAAGTGPRARRRPRLG